MLFMWSEEFLDCIVSRFTPLCTFVVLYIRWTCGLATRGERGLGVRER